MCLGYTRVVAACNALVLAWVGMPRRQETPLCSMSSALVFKVAVVVHPFGALDLCDLARPVLL